MNPGYTECIIIKNSDIPKPRKSQPPTTKIFRDKKIYSRKNKHKEDISNLDIH